MARQHRNRTMLSTAAFLSLGGLILLGLALASCTPAALPGSPSLAATAPSQQSVSLAASPQVSTAATNTRSVQPTAAAPVTAAARSAGISTPGAIAAATLTGAPAAAVSATLEVQIAPTSANRVLRYTVEPGDRLSEIAQRFGVTAATLIQANSLQDADVIRVGQVLLIPDGGSTTGLQSPDATSAEQADKAPTATPRPSAMERLPELAKSAAPGSPLYRNIWVTYYGSPGVPVMGILGEYGIDGLVPKLKAQAEAYRSVASPDLGITPAFHLVYGTATKADGTNNSHLAYLSKELINKYIDRAQTERFGVILDVQIGNLAPLAAIQPAFDFLKTPQVELALDPEFAMVTPGQTIPGNPPGAITAGQINEVQAAMQAFMQEQGITEHKMLIVHQFLPSMIIDKQDIMTYDGIDVVICADGYGTPWPKVSKYNSFMSDGKLFAGFKLFYRWDEPLMNERQTLGVDPYPGIGYMEVTPSLVVYQ